jgi:hypothetical protein
MIVQKRDFRKRKGRNVFFLLQAVPFFILTVLVVFMINNSDIERNQNLIVSKHLEVPGITGNMINTLGLSNTTYGSGDLLEGDLTVAFGSGDFLPLNTNFSFRLFAQYPIAYVCGDGTIYEWKDVDGQSVDPSPIDLCGDDVETHYNCTSTSYGKHCCQYGVNGAIYGNLDCSTGKVCGEECLTPSIKTLQDLVSKSTTPDRGNYTPSPYRNNGQPIPGLSPTSGPGVGYCFNTSGGVINGTPFVNYGCVDSDGAGLNNISVYGTCKDWITNFSTSYNDFCGSGLLFEKQCAGFFKVVNYDYCESAKCIKIGSPTEGYYANCSLGPTELEQVLVVQGNCSVLPSGVKPIFGQLANGSYAWQGITGLEWELYVCGEKYIDCDLGCSGGKCESAEGNGSCSGWTSNAYAIPLDRLGIYAPSMGGKYNFEVLGYWNTTTLSIFTTSFTVAARHKACVNSTCRYVNGFGADDCESSDDCGGCDPDWVYGSWSDCVSGYKFRNKVDVNNCSANRIENQSCQSCTSNWFCAWQQCSDGSIQQKICTDSMGCDSSNISYISGSRPCCIENWKATFGSCVNKVEIVNYQDLNSCGTEFSKPLTKTKSCGSFLPELFAKWYFWVIVVLILAIVFLILFFTVFHKQKYDYETTSMTSPRNLENPSLIGKEEITEDVKTKPKETGRVTKRTVKEQTEESKQKTATIARIGTGTARSAEYPTELMSYIQAAMAAGASKEEVRAKLLEVGWQEEVVDGILAGL